MATPQETSPSDSGKTRLLLICPEVETARSIEKLLPEVPGFLFEIHHVLDFPEAFKALARSSFQVCLVVEELDPNKSANFLHVALFKQRGLPWILLTRLEESAGAMEALRLGASDFFNLQKLDSATLERSIRYTLERFRTEKAFRGKEELFRSVLDNAMEGLSIIAMDGRLLYASSSIERILGYKHDEAMKLNMFALLHPDELSQALERLKWAADHPGNVLREEFRLKHHNGHWLQLELVGKSEFFHSFNEQVVILDYRDITERKNAQQVAERLSLIVETSNDAIYTISKEGAILSWNPSAREIYGYPAEEISGRHFSILMPPIEEAAFEDAFKAVLAGTTLGSFHAEHLTKSGRPLPVSLTLSPIREPAGEIFRVSVIARDISELHKYVETAKRLSSFLENAPLIMVSTDQEGRITLWNRFAENLYGYKAGEMMGQKADILEPPEKSGETAKYREEILSGKPHLSYQSQRRKKDGSTLELEFQIFPATDARGKTVGVTSIGRDITDKLRADKVLAESEARFRRIFEKSPFGMVLTTPGGIFRTVNRRFCEILGYDFRELAGKSFAEITHPGDLAKDLDALQKLSRGDMNSYETEKRYLHKDGRVVWVHLVVAAMGKTREDDTLFLGIVEDTTEKRLASEISYRFSEVLVHTPDAITSSDLKGIIGDWNRAAEKMFGYKAEEMIGQSASLLAAPGKEKEQAGLWEKVSKGETVMDFETTRRRKNGEIFEVSLTLSPMKDFLGQVTGMASITRDISGRKKTEKALREQEEHLKQAQKMDAIGRLAGGVAHDFNNLLSVIGANAGFILNDPGPNPHREELEEIDKAVKHGAELTKQLLLLGQKQVTQAQALQLNDLCWETSRMIKRLFDASIDLVMDLDPALKPIYADPAQIQQVVLNLALNARDAMPQGGRLTIQTRNEIPPKEDSLSEPGPFVKLSIADTGTGMDPEIQKQVFDPFFTTKKGKGTGLGLTTVYGIVKQWKGQIRLQSVAGEGTVFSVFFPVHAGGKKKSSLPQQVPLVPDGTETVLVAEDDLSVRKAVVRSLESFGYKVLEAGDGVEAIQQSWNYKGEIHLLLTDTVMPKLNGRHLAEELGPIRPKMKVIFISGYPKEILSRKGEIDPGIRLLTKPFAMEDMVREVRKVLDEKKK